MFSQVIQYPCATSIRLVRSPYVGGGHGRFTFVSVSVLRGHLLESPDILATLFQDEVYDIPGTLTSLIRAHLVSYPCEYLPRC